MCKRKTDEWVCDGVKDGKMDEHKKQNIHFIVVIM